MPIKILPIYDRVFTNEGKVCDKDTLKSFATDPSSTDVIQPSSIDFEIIPEKEKWLDECRRVALIILKIIIFPLIIYEVIKSFIGGIVMENVLPAQSRSLGETDKSRSEAIESETEEGQIIRHVILRKNEINFSGLLISSKENISNGNWVLHAVGNNIPIENAVPGQIQPYYDSKYNVLLINEPNVGRSRGSATVENMGHSQEVAISFLESAIKAKKIVLTGHSIGGAAIGKAILQHSFRKDVKYLVIRLMTFDRLSHLVERMLGSIGRLAIHWLDCEMDSIASSKKLESLDIPEVIVQAGKDEIMEGAELKDGLQLNGITKNKQFFVIKKADHNEFPADLLQDVIKKWDPTPPPSLLMSLLNRVRPRLSY